MSVPRPPIRARWRWRALAIALVAGALAAVISTYATLSQAYDEPAHIGAGMEWLGAGRYTFEAQHPPLGRIAAALGPYLAGERLVLTDMWGEGNRILGSGDHYRRTLTLARVGELPFLLILCAACWLWGTRLGGERVGVLAVLGVVANPNVLAHAGFATTDIGPVALLPLALYAFVRWLEHPATGRSVALGLALGIAAVTKFSVIAFLVPTLAVGWVLRVREESPRREAPGESDRSRYLRPAALASAVAALAVWAVYRFDVGPMENLTLTVPAPAFFDGIIDFLIHGGSSHASFLLGRISSRGWWYYFPVVLVVKTPLPLLLLGLAGAGLAVRDLIRRRAWDAGVLAIGLGVILLVGMATKVNIGVRHILPLYPLLAILAASAVVRSWDALAVLRGKYPRFSLVAIARGAVAGMLAASLVIVVRARPDFVAYFNPLAGDHPERVLSDSNIDWGQDLGRLARELRARNVDSLTLAYFGSAEPTAVGIEHARPYPFRGEVSGWIAVSETYLAGLWSTDDFEWLRAYTPVTEVGRSIRLYYVPASIARTPSPATVLQAGGPVTARRPTRR